MKIYISGKITGTQDYMKRFCELQNKLETAGYQVINPALICSNLPTGTTHKEYMSICLPLIDMCEVVFMMIGWEDSEGAKKEMEYAIKQKRILCFENNEILFKSFGLDKIIERK